MPNMSPEGARDLLAAIAAVLATCALLTCISDLLIHWLIVPAVVVVLIWAAQSLNRR